MECYFSVKKKMKLLNLQEWIELETIILNEVTQPWKDKHFIFFLKVEA